jgi:hypothetical protein
MEEKMNNALMKMGGEFDSLRARWAVMSFGEAKDDLCEVLNERAAAIRALPADDLAGLAVKARAAAWTCNLDHVAAGDYSGEVMAALVADVQHVAAFPRMGIA